VQPLLFKAVVEPKRPASHAAQGMPPVEYLPTPQSVHVLAALMDPVPGVHAAHTVGDEAAITVDAVPAAQAVQMTASVVYLPAMHWVHVDA
jgi:hypothetical protein